MVCAMYKAGRDAEKAHKITRHHKSGLMWASCECGWESQKLDSYCDTQSSQTMQSAWNHVNCMIARADAKYREELQQPKEK
jgi:hypothetical protein